MDLTSLERESLALFFTLFLSQFQQLQEPNSYKQPRGYACIWIPN